MKTLHVNIEDLEVIRSSLICYMGKSRRAFVKNKREGNFEHHPVITSRISRLSRLIKELDKQISSTTIEEASA